MTKPDFAKAMKEGTGLSGFKWPDVTSDFNMAIDRQGRWFHDGGEITRLALRQLFSTVLQKDEEDRYWLVTPVERGEIKVEDVPFFVCEMHVSDPGTDQIIHFRNSLEHWIEVDADHPITVQHDPETQEPSPYVEMRDGLKARISRTVFYDLVELGYEQNGQWCVSSKGTVFSLGDFDA